jgi:transposase InsO family protein
MQPQAHLTIESMCYLAGVSRAGYYRHWQEREPRAAEMSLRSEVQEIVLAHRRNYGYRRVTRELQARGWAVNHKRVARIMREDNLLCLRKRRFVVTTDSEHTLEVYVNVAAHMQLTGIDQLWVADLTYIRLSEEYVYLAVVLDAYSRRVVGWSLGDCLCAGLPLAALCRALEARRPAPGLVHHSDQGVQYAGHDYIGLLREHGATPSMSRVGNPYDNAKCESFIKTLKQEEIYTREYRDRADLEEHIGEFIDNYYNRQRLHSALNYRSPEQFERSLLAESSSVVVRRVSFLRHEESIVPMLKETGREEL